MDEIALERLDLPLTEEELAALEKIGDVTRHPKGSILMGEGETTKSVLLIRKGHVKVVAGNPARIVAIRGPGDLIGEMAAIRNKPRSASIFALEDVEALQVSSSDWLKFLSANFRATLALLYTCQERLAESTHLTVMSQLAAEQKLARSLVDLWTRGLGAVSGGKKVLRFSQLDLAELAGISTDSVKKVVRALKAKGVISMGRQSIVILDLPALELIARD
ncbi:cAMP-binding domain of CRP or a regulatory subunit of cAMP-dependent protein kinases [Lentzea xinjiangensis]|uniref:cAMP-binding domain of CRP or a regulatory subunit of cAMP-dependent protein kinases n=1 Tax=Lentzea xinjiangensis TaxID=402600 RepID=A0A1H9ACE8_9PSEU|nr:Crp/Fnr family transcriptional regulator [Lentzea xinjiangensis]SEP74416.1 cAMP-binding domain of CRP or a regulatory subunit of cAMP-dependent protein kinases [Lentzea xinjiangensis]